MPFISAIVAAGSIGGAIAVSAGFTATGLLAGAINAVIGVGLSMGLSALSGALGSKNQNTEPGEVSATLQIGGNIPRQVAFGRLATRGQFAFAATAGVANERLCQVFLLSDGWCAGLDAVWVGDQRYALEPVAPDGNAVAKFYVAHYGDTGFGEKRFNVWFYDGRPGQLPPQRPIGYAPDRVGPSDRYAGLAYVVVELINNNDTFDSVPDLLWELRGYRCHDPRKDPAFGGTGTHSLADPATWEFSENPALHVWNYLRGIRSEGQVFMGLELADYDVLADHFIVAANICDEAVPLDAGGAEPRYRASALLTAQDGDHRAALAPLIQAMAGYLIERNGSFGLLAGAAQLPVETITDNDIVWDRGVKWSGSRSRTERTNEVHGQFVDPSAGWQANSYPSITSAVYSAEDGERLAVSLDLGSVTSATQAQRIARARMRETRRQASATLTVGMHLLWLEAGDWLRWDSARFGANRLYRVVSRDLNPDDTVTLALREVGNEIYSWNAADEQPYAPPATIPGEGPLPSTVTGFAVQPDVIEAPDGATRPVLNVMWDPIADTRVKAVIIEYRPIGRVAASRVRDDSPGDGLYVLDQPPTGLDYEFRASIATVPARPVSWTHWVQLSALGQARWLPDVTDIMARFRSEIEWAPVLMPDLASLMWNTSMSAVSADTKAEASIRRVEEVNVTQTEARATFATQVSTRFAATEGQVTILQQSVSTIEGTTATLATQVQATSEGLTTLSATVSTVQTAVTGLTGTVATHTQQIAVNASGLGNISGTVTSQGSAIVDLQSNKASVSYANEINAKANGASAGGQIVMTAEAGAAGPSSRIRLRASATQGGALADAGMLIEAGNGGQISFIASKFVFIDNTGAAAFSPFFYASGVWVMNGAIVIRSGTTGERIEITNQNFKVYDANNVLRVAIGINI